MRCKRVHPHRGKRCELDEGHSGPHLVAVEGYSSYHAGLKCIKIRQDAVEKWDENEGRVDGLRGGCEAHG